jgi:superfamily I DNA/RNA helicase
MLPSTVLAVLAELAPAGGDRIYDVTRGGQPLVWLADAERAPRKADVDRLAALDALHREERILRRGWGFVAGRAELDGVPRKVRVPLLSQPVRLDRGLTGYRVVPAGDLEVTALLADRELAAALEAAPGLAAPGWLDATGSRAWLSSAAEATGLPIDATVERGGRLPADRLVLVAGAALFVVRDVFGARLGDSLRTWAGRPLGGTALAALYGEPPASQPDDSPVLSPLPLTRAQAAVVARARTAPVTVVSGPPGNGKSHVVVAAALEVVDRGGSVLVATQSSQAAEVLGGLLARYPGPAPVLFGDAERRTALAAGLAAGTETGIADRELRADRAAVRRRLELVREAREVIRAGLDLERRAAELPAWQPLLSGLAAEVPGAFDDEAAALLARARRPGAGWWQRWRGRRVLRTAPGVPEERVTEALAAADAQRAAARLAATGGTDLTARWAALHEAEAALAGTVGAAMRRASRSDKRWTSEARRGTAALATALRSGRNRRRELLAALDGPPLIRALPLWIGTVADVEDLLPATPGLFDLVVIDEASHVDQVRAAPVLARARRALIVGDPRQLRFVSFVSDVDMAEVLTRHGADERLDVRRVSTYDLAAGAAPAIWLEEHHRSAPHLIGFSAHRFYGDRIAVATRHPRTETRDAIDVVRVGGASVSNGVNAAEVTAVVEVVRELAGSGRTGIGVISPFRPQAEALEAALLAAFPADRIEELRLRVGTVHAFQGSEAEVVVASLGLVSGDGAGRRRFVADPHLFNVLITRARERLIVVTSLDSADGLIGDYLAYADKPPGPEPGGEPGGWAATLGAELSRLEVAVRPDYAVGGWRLDLCVGPAETAIGVLCGVHPDGPDAHVDRQRALHRSGWRLVDGFPSRWQGDPRRAALEIAAQLTLPRG